MDAQASNRLAAAFLGGTMGVSQTLTEIWGTTDVSVGVVTALTVVTVHYAVSQFAASRRSTTDDNTRPEVAQ